MTYTAYFFVSIQAFFGTWYEVPPSTAKMQGTAQIRPTTAPTTPSRAAIVGDTVFVSGAGWGVIENIEPNTKLCKNF